MQLYQPTITGSLLVSGSIVATGGITVTNPIASASYANSASYAATAISASYAVNATSASWITGSNVVGVVSNTTSASFAVQAQTASFANTFTVNSTLTAQTLVVQTITSSVSTITGSTNFGSLSVNTHQFTGSLLVTGSIGIGIAAPGVALDVNGYSKFTGIGINANPTSIGANPNYIRITNSGGDFYIGQEGSTNGGFFNGSIAYDSALYSGRSINLIINGVSRMYVSSSGDVGIGRSTPNAKLEIESTRNSTLLRLTATSGENWDFKNTNTTGTTDVLSIGANGATANLNLLDNGYVGIGTSTIPHSLTIVTPANSGSGIQLLKSGYVTSFLGDGGSSYPVGVLNLYDSGSQKVQIYAGGTSYFTGGNVGIGTTSPTALLTVAGTSDLAWGASTSKLQISRSGTVARLQNYDNGSAANLSLQWDGGNVGIGTTNPGSKLELASSTSVASLRLNSSGGGQNASVEIYQAGSAKWEIGTGMATSSDFEIRDRVNSVNKLTISNGGPILLRSRATNITQGNCVNMQEWVAYGQTITAGSFINLFNIKGQYDNITGDFYSWVDQGSWTGFTCRFLIGYGGFGTTAVLGNSSAFTLSMTGTTYNETLRITNNSGNVNNSNICVRIWGRYISDGVGSGGTDLITSSYLTRIS